MHMEQIGQVLLTIPAPMMLLCRNLLAFVSGGVSRISSQARAGLFF